jgi:endonuclease-3
MTKKERYGFVISWFKEYAPSAETELIFDSPFQLLVAVVLSAQCTDKRVNMTTPALFARYPTIKDLANAEYETLFDIIKSISYPGNKTRHLIGMAKMLQEKFNGEIPLSVDELIQLPVLAGKPQT